MTGKILLDYKGDASAPSGFQIVESEVAFLRVALSNKPILIRGERLCSWAEAFYALHEQPVQPLVSSQTELRRVFPSLSDAQAKELATKVKFDSLPLQNITPVTILNHCYPDDYALWQGSPSLQHAAQWLIWLIDHNPSDAEKIVLESIASILMQHAGDAPEAELYKAVDTHDARELLYRWLGADEPSIQGLGEFPLSLPGRLLTKVKDRWMKRIIQQKGAFFEEMLKTPLPITLRQELASLTVTFFKENPQHLTRAALQALQSYIKTKDLTALDERMPPPEPSQIPDTETEVLTWFQNEYLPYRRWQTNLGDDDARHIAVQHAQSFQRWVLRQYPKWFLDGKWLVFQRAAQLSAKTENSLILCIILDGLPAWDAEDIERDISSKIERLTLQQKDYCFTSIPTVTQFAKEALLKGVPPRLAPQSKPVGEILPDKVSPSDGLKDFRAGDIVFWRVEQPDKAYHFVHKDKRERQVRAELDTILQAIQETVEMVPDDIVFQVIITSDHGRLLNPWSPRQVPIPKQTEVHGRAAWGRFETIFDENGFTIDEQAGWIDISGQRFEIEHNVRVIWGEESFRSQQGGDEAYPHGGIFPEEIIVPWFVFTRDATSPRIDIRIRGTGEASMSGELIVTIVNNSRQRIDCLEVSLSHGVAKKCMWTINPLSEKQQSISITPWPTKNDLENLVATLLLRQPNGATFVREVIPNIDVESLYERQDDILKDLGL